MVRPSPPPWGWSIGFIAVPRTWGRLPFHTLRPALPITSFMWSGLDTAPTVAMQVSGILRTSAGIQAHQRITGVAAQILGIGAGGTRHLAALARLHFDIVDDGADRHRAQRHGIAGLHVDLVARHHGVADGQALRRQDVGQLAVLVLDQRDEGGAVGIVFQTLDRRGLVELAALEIDQAIALLVTAALLAHHDAAGIVAAALGVLPSVSALTGPPLCRPERSTSTSWRWPGVVGLYCFRAMA